MHIRPSHGKLQLTLTDLDELAAPLHECLNLREYGIQTEIPLLRVLLAYGRCHLIVDLSPLASTRNGILEILNALLHIAIEHVVHVDLFLASFDDFVADLMQ